MSVQPTEREPIDLVADDFLDRYRRGERPSLSEYIQQHPELAEEIRELFPALVMIEQAGSATAGALPSIAGDEPPRSRIGEFRLVRPVGRGGMGVVYEAVQESLERRVALKVLPLHAMLAPKQLARFQREARAAAALHHSHIVPVFSVGQCDGVHYYAMQFIDGCGLDVVVEQVREVRRLGTIASESLSPTSAARSALQPNEKSHAGGRPETGNSSTVTIRAAETNAVKCSRQSLLTGGRSEYCQHVAEIGAQAAEALAYAHSQGILHRDIKPSNLMLDQDANLWITDFGLAKFEAAEGMTQTGDVVGTLRYMAPEQLQGWSDPRTDVHGLGLVLYELLALRPAFDAAERGRLLTQVGEYLPPPLGRVNARVPRDLETIVTKAIAKEPGERYASAAEMVADLRRFLADQPIRARRASVVERLQRWCRRNPVTSLLSLAVVLLLGLVAGTSSAMWWQAQASLVAVSKAEHEKTDQLWRSRLNEVLALRRTGLAGQRWQSWEKLKEGVDLVRQVGAGEEGRRSLRNAAISSLALTDLRSAGPGPVESPGVTIMGFDPTLAKYVRCDSLGNISVRGVVDDREVASLPATGPDREKWPWVGGPRFSGDGRLLAVVYFKHEFGFQSGQVVVWNVEQQEIALIAPAKAWMFAYDLSRDGRSLVVGQDSGIAVVYDVASGNETARIKLPYVAHSIRLSPQGNRLATTNANAGSDVFILDLPTGVALHRFRQDGGGEMGWHPEGQLLGVTGRDFLVHVWNLSTGREQCVLRGHQAIPHGPAFTPDGEVLLTSTYDGTVRLWHAWTGTELVRCAGTAGSLMSADGERVAVRQGSQFVFFEIERSAEYHTLPLAAASATDRFECSPGPQHPRRQWLPVAGHDGIRLLDLDTGRELAAARVGHTRSLAWSPDGNEMYSVGMGGLYRWPIVERDSGVSIGPPQKIGSEGDSVAVDPSGKELAVGSMSQRAYWLALGPTVSNPRPINHTSATTTHYSSDGRWFVAGTHHGRGIKIWSRDHKQELPLLLPDVSRTCPVFSPDSQILAANRNGLVQLWRVGDWQPIRSLATIGGHFPSFVFSPDGLLLAWSRTPYQVCLEEVATGRELAIFEATDDLQVSGLLFSRDGSRLIVSTSYPPTLRVWDLARVRRQLLSLNLADDLLQWKDSSGSMSGKNVEFDEGLTVKQLESRAELFRRRRQLERACADLERVLLLDPDNVAVLNRLAWLRCIGPAIVRDPAKAASLSRQACAASPEDPFCLNTLGATLYRQGRYAEALEALTKGEHLARDRNVGFPLALRGFFQAMCRQRLGLKDEARQAYAEAAKWLAANRANTSPAWASEAETLQAEAFITLDMDHK